MSCILGSTRRAYLEIAAAACWALSLSGCGASKPPSYDVTGTVTFEGAPVEEGSVLFEDPATGAAKQVPLEPGGKYTLNLPPGNYNVALTPPLGEGRSRGDTPEDADYKPVPNIPRKYWNVRASGFTADVDEGNTTFTFDMTKP